LGSNRLKGLLHFDEPDRFPKKCKLEDHNHQHRAPPEKNLYIPQFSSASSVPLCFKV
jgi:hypothetical protein